MTTDELLNILPGAIGNNPVKNDKGEVVAYVLDKPEDSYEFLQLLNDGKDWLASYGQEGEFVCIGQDENGFYKNLFAYGDTPNEALQKLYDLLVNYNLLNPNESTI